MSRLAALAGASVVAISIATSAGASTIDVTSVAFSDGSTSVLITGASSGIPSVPVPTLNANVGRLRLTTDSVDIFAWCVDLYETIDLGGRDRTYTLGTLVANLTNPPAPLTAAQIDRIGGLAEAGDNELAANPGDTTASAAYQAAIWQTIYGGTYDGNSAFDTKFALVVSGTYSLTAGTLLQELDARGEPLTQQLYTLTPIPVVGVPVPGALGLFGFALAGLVLAGRRKA
jgi:hypothetical protein